MSRTMPRVIIADSSLMNRWTIRRALAPAPEVRIAGEAQNARQLMAAIRRTRAQALIVDAKILSGQVPLIKAIIARERLPVVVLANTSDPRERELAGKCWRRERRASCRGCPSLHRPTLRPPLHG